MPARPPFSGDGTRPPDRNAASAYAYVTGRSKPAALSGTRQPRGDPTTSSRYRLNGAESRRRTPPLLIRPVAAARLVAAAPGPGQPDVEREDEHREDGDDED